MKINTSKNDLKDTGVSVSQKDFYNCFVEMGFPNKKKEEWKFTDLDKILNSNFDAPFIVTAAPFERTSWVASEANLIDLI